MDRVILKIDREGLITEATIGDHTIKLGSLRTTKGRGRSYGGSGLPSPSELLSASVGGCFGITMKSLINAWRVGDQFLSDLLEEVWVEVEGVERRGEEGVSIEKIYLNTTIALAAVERGVVEAFLEKLPGVVRRWCPVTTLASKAVPVEKRVRVLVGGEVVEKEF